MKKSALFKNMTVFLQNSEISDSSTDLIQESQHKRTLSIWSGDFESAITATGFGKFNVFLVIVAIFTGLTSVFEPRSNAYVVPAAQCDLHLDLHRKAVLNSVPLAGMVMTSIIGGIIGDTIGRRKSIIIICFLDFSCWMMAAFSQSFEVLFVARLLGGIVSSGIYPSLVSYLTEIHEEKYRAVMQLFMGSIFGLGDLLLPTLALIILTREETFEFSSMVFHQWNIYLIVCGMFPLIGAIGFLFLPESPKFLMSKSENDKAIDVFQSIYIINIKNTTKEEYPVKSLKTPVNNSNGIYVRLSLRSQMAQFLEGKNLRNILLAMFAEWAILMGLNAILLWLPQLFQEMNNHQRQNNNSISVCQTLNKLERKTNKINDNCEEDMTENVNIYVYCMIVASATILLFVISGSIINTIGKKKLLYILGVLSAVSNILLFLAEDILLTVFLSSVICAIGNIGFNALVAIVVDIFPTNLRAISVSLTMMIGRLGGAMGSFVFPFFLKYGCLDALLFISYINLISVFVVYFLPNEENPDLQKKSKN